MIPFNKPYVAGKEFSYIKQAIQKGQLAGNGFFTKQCEAWLENRFGCAKALLTHSCTASLEMAAILSGVKPGDDVIMPSYTFVSTANAFALRGARIVFVDIRPDTMNIDETKIAAAITPRTRAIVPVHYGGVACDMDTIMALARKHRLCVVEDAAQGVMARYKGKYLGAIGHIGCYSFHETKNYTCGEGGAIALNDRRFIERAEIIREKGTDRSRFLRGQVDKYTWVDIGSSYVPAELNAAFLSAQLESADEIAAKRIGLWDLYYKSLLPLSDRGVISLPHIPKDCAHSAHMFYIKVKDLKTRGRLIDHLKAAGILSVFHYIPLHSSKAGKRFGRFSGKDEWTTKESLRLLRLPLFGDLTPGNVRLIVNTIKKFYV
ncbi:MAG: dTDP-4-amino-4,6-dideoxygalactose transaminase [Candidatus Omnitrophota bacterium]